MSLVFLFSAMLLQGSIQPAAEPRRILIFGNHAEPLVKQQLQLLQQDSTGLKERDVQIKMVGPGSSLYKTYEVSTQEPFTIILVGRDKGEKYRSNQVTAAIHFYALIDAMPMRRAEMRQQKKKRQ